MSDKLIAAGGPARESVTDYLDDETPRETRAMRRTTKDLIEWLEAEIARLTDQWEHRPVACALGECMPVARQEVRAERAEAEVARLKGELEREEAKVLEVAEERDKALDAWRRKTEQFKAELRAHEAARAEIARMRLVVELGLRYEEAHRTVLFDGPSIEEEFFAAVRKYREGA